MTAATWIYPSGLTGLACVIHQSNPDRIAWSNPENSKCLKYAGGMGLFQFHQNRPSWMSADSSPENSAFARLARIDYTFNPTPIAKNISKIVEKEAPHIHGDIVSSLDERLQNIKDHAQSPGFAAAQASNEPGGNRSYNFAVCDWGQGIAQALKENSDLTIHSDQQALDLACQRKISGKIHRKSLGYPTNFGMGLFHVDEMARKYNGLFILTSNTAVRIREGETVRNENNARWQGTGVELRLFYSSLSYKASVPTSKSFRLGR